jgi:hypothetical protein
VVLEALSRALVVEEVKAVAEADPKWWNLDLFLAEIIAINLRDYARNNKSYPGEYTAESWKSKLDSIATRLEAYKHRFEAPVALEQHLVNEARAAMHELAEIFPGLWS